MRYLLDTNICIYIINNRPEKVLQRFRKERIGNIGISSITASELTYGVIKSGSERNRLALEMFMAPLEIYPFDESVIWQYGEVRANLEKQGKPIGALDTMIAAHALALNTILVTNNTREFNRVDGLHYENWAE
ncbi:type II toxin-antitoxin system VapC family toxin [Prosthecochloris sp. SCSIO W1102]|uniref:type II toxin-antitoxin system tRNA(fMet)-specific endonuclease VapC n=1 Tax=Prosthecochloris sp. SCSIO W1102 TaxID=2992243 RepID=UPI00223DF94D|nr:type II toxin-antitoxin system VapC family toxin [Prosthecochloris sp. SCSIO W1102]UZJ39794.1 type II toxin-antitoxin system VapC family toxin [Prosthecochloris sp. SCSIO W1102]